MERGRSLPDGILECLDPCRCGLYDRQPAVRRPLRDTGVRRASPLERRSTRLRIVLGDVSQFAPGLVAALLIGLITGPVLARLLDVSRLLGAAISASLGAIVLTTLAPIGDPAVIGPQTGTCDLSRLGPSALSALLTINEISLNVLLFLPLGLTLGVMRRSWQKVAMVVVAALLPVAIEALQLMAPRLGRFCDSADVADNLTGLAIGFALGTVVGTAATLVRMARTSRAGS